MELTDKEARARHCVVTLETGTIYVGGGRCVGDACMAWRWSGQRETQLEAGPAAEFAEPGCVQAVMVERTGYCGMAGVPQEAAMRYVQRAVREAIK